MDHTTVSLHSRLTSTRNRWQRAHTRIESFLAAHPHSYISWSGGKDSTAVAALVHQVRPVPVVRFSHGADYPEVTDYCDTLARTRRWDYHVIELATLDEYLARTLAHIETAPTAHADPHHTSTARALLGDDLTGLIWGLRADESTGRRWNGITRQRADGITTHAPLYDWSTLDVLAWLDHTHIELCPIYARLAALGAPPEAQRVGYTIGAAATDHGRLTWFRRGWPDLWAEYAQRTPALTGYA